MIILICILLIVLVTIGIVNTSLGNIQAEQEYVPIPVKVDETGIFQRNIYRH